MQEFVNVFCFLNRLRKIRQRANTRGPKFHDDSFNHVQSCSLATRHYSTEFVILRGSGSVSANCHHFCCRVIFVSSSPELRRQLVTELIQSHCSPSPSVLEMTCLLCVLEPGGNPRLRRAIFPRPRNQRGGGIYAFSVAETPRKHEDLA